LGINKAGKYAPIRPMFINVFSLIKGENALIENKVISYDYRIFSPHTIRRETRLCPTCHEDKETFLISIMNQGFLCQKKMECLLNLLATGK